MNAEIARLAKAAKAARANAELAKKDFRAINGTPSYWMAAARDSEEQLRMYADELLAGRAESSRVVRLIESR